MYGVRFGDKHTYTDWGLILRSRPVISPPTPKTMYIDIPEADGRLDLTESLSGEVRYNNRSITFQFVVIEARKRWTQIYSEILNYLHGQEMIIHLDEDRNYYYVGRISVDEWASDKKTSVITISGDVNPYKLEIHNSLDDWLWDEFNFEEDLIRDYKDLTVNGSLNFVIWGSRRSSVPVFVVNSNGQGMRVVFNGVSYNLQDGRNRVLNIVIRDGANNISFVGNGTVSIEYQGGSL